MRNLHFTSVMAAMLAVALLSQANAQTHQIPRSPTHYDPSGGTAYHNSPFIPIPFEFDPFHWHEETDAQFFAHADLGDLGEPAPQKTGFFASYERVNWRFSRPNQGPQLTGNAAGRYNNIMTTESMDTDGGWGNRYEFGWGEDKGDAWLIRHTSARVNSYYNVPIITSSFAAGTLNDNDLNGIPDEWVILPSTQNDASYQNWELNRVFRLKRMYRGGVLEPYAGIRYSQFNHKHRESAIVAVEATGVIRGNPGLVLNPLINNIITIPPTIIALGATSDNYFMLTSTVDNDMFGGQLGVRWRNQRGRWKFGFDTRAFGMHNWQTATGTFDHTQIVTTSLVVIENATEQSSQTRVTDSNRDFVYGGELKLEIGLQATRDISLVAGVDGIIFARGISRDVLIPSQTTRRIDTEESAFMFGASIGIEYNK